MHRISVRFLFLLAVSALSIMLLACSPETSAPAHDEVEPGLLRIATQPGDAELLINGEHHGRTPAAAGQTYSTRLPSGEYLIEAHKPLDAYREYRGRLQHRHDDTRSAAPVELVLEVSLTAAGVQQQADEALRLEAHQRAALERFVPAADGTVADNRLGLIWMRCSLGQTWTGSGCEGEARQLNWDQALEAATGFEYAGMTGWRLPAQPELHSLTHCSTGRRFQPNADGMGAGCAGEYERPTILVEVFPGTPAANFWTSTPHERFAFSAWGVSFHSGHTGTGGRTDYVHVRLVRDAD